MSDYLERVNCEDTGCSVSIVNGKYNVEVFVDPNDTKWYNYSTLTEELNMIKLIKEVISNVAECFERMGKGFANAHRERLNDIERRNS